jgi:hypothetical protein
VHSSRTGAQYQPRRRVVLLAAAAKLVRHGPADGPRVKVTLAPPLLAVVVAAEGLGCGWGADGRARGRLVVAVRKPEDGPDRPVGSTLLVALLLAEELRRRCTETCNQNATMP